MYIYIYIYNPTNWLNTVGNGVNVEAKSMVKYIGIIFDQDKARSSTSKRAMPS